MQVAVQAGRRGGDGGEEAVEALPVGLGQLLAAVDPAAHQLAHVRQPPGVGGGLVDLLGQHGEAFRQRHQLLRLLRDDAGEGALGLYQLILRPEALAVGDQADRPRRGQAALVDHLAGAELADGVVGVDAGAEQLGQRAALLVVVGECRPALAGLDIVVQVDGFVDIHNRYILKLHPVADKQVQRGL